MDLNRKASVAYYFLNILLPTTNPTFNTIVKNYMYDCQFYSCSLHRELPLCARQATTGRWRRSAEISVKLAARHKKRRAADSEVCLMTEALLLSWYSLSPAHGAIRLSIGVFCC